MEEKWCVQDCNCINDVCVRSATMTASKFTVDLTTSQLQASWWLAKLPCGEAQRPFLLFDLPFPFFLFIPFSHNICLAINSYKTLSFHVMNSSRTAVRAARVLNRAPLRTNVRHIRPQSTASSTNTQAAAAGGSSGLVGGIAGGVLVFAVCGLLKSYNKFIN